ncbi:MAG: hypothetical protein CM15mP74_27680 [Halieaceae bacterium]|nr:MAG: hypothetical protein CM15mP74_27680 [Halieaceae bacterium]
MYLLQDRLGEDRVNRMFAELLNNTDSKDSPMRQRSI